MVFWFFFLLLMCRIEKLYDGKVYAALRIPDADTGARQDIDMVHVTKGYDSIF